MAFASSTAMITCFFISRSKTLSLLGQNLRFNHVECFAIPVGNTVLPVAGHTAHVIHNRFALFQQAVKQRAFPYVRPSYYCYSEILPYIHILNI